MVPTMISPHGGISGVCSSAARMFMCQCSRLEKAPAAVSAGAAGSLAEDEGDDQADEGQGLRQGGTEERVGAGEAGGLRLAGGGLDVGRPHDTDTDAGADRGEAVTDGADAAGQFCQNVHLG